jgi:hypothetical protein
MALRVSMYREKLLRRGSEREREGARASRRRIVCVCVCRSLGVYWEKPLKRDTVRAI